MLSTKPFKCPDFLLEKAQQGACLKTAIVNPSSLSVMQGAKWAFEKNIIDPIFIGYRKEIKACASKLDWDISSFAFFETSNDIECADKAVELASEDKAFAIMKGYINTDVLLSRVLNKKMQLVQNTFLSHIFYMTVEGSNKALMITDGVLNVSPSQKIKKDILRNAISFAQKLGYKRPKVALLSATEKPTKSIPSSIEADELRQWAEGNITDADVYGPLALDNAISPNAAAIKKIDNVVAGHADILLVDSLETGNALFKFMIYFLSACAGGLVLGGKVPIILNSRSDPPEASLASIALANIIVSNKA